MSKLSDALKFDAFQFKDMWKQIKKDPERLLFGMGTLDPLSTKLTNKVFGTDYEPLTDISGGPYGGHTSSLFSGKDGGVYKRAQEAGLDTKSRGQVSDIGSVAGLLFGAGAGLGALGGGAAGGTASGGLGGAGGGVGSGVTSGTVGTVGGSAIAPTSVATLAPVTVTGSGGTAAVVGGSAAGGAAAGANSNFDWQRMMRQMPQQQRQASTYQPVDLMSIATDPEYLQSGTDPAKEAMIKKYMVHALRGRA